MKKVEPNLDKSHRCPQCHKMPIMALLDRRVILGRRYECVRCEVEWTFGKSKRLYQYAAIITVEASSYEEGLALANDVDIQGEPEGIISFEHVIEYEKDNEGQRVLYLHSEDKPLRKVNQ